MQDSLEIAYGLVEVEDDMCGGESGVAAEVHLDLAGEPPARSIMVKSSTLSFTHGAKLQEKFPKL